MRYDTSMAVVKQRVDPVRLLWRRALMGVLTLILLLAAWAVWGVWQKERESRHLRGAAEGRLHEMQGRYDALTADVAALGTEGGQETVLRDTYDVGKPGERLIVIVDEKQQGTTTAEPPATTSRPWWRFW